MNDLVTYAYAVARADDMLHVRAAVLKGVADSPVHLVPGSHDDTLVLVVSHVPAQDFQEDALKLHLEDLDWLEAVARAHHGVIEAMAVHTTVLPLRLATVYLDDTRARDVLDARRALFAERLAHLAEHVEWGVKIHVEPSSAPAAPAPQRGEALSPGRAYLRDRRQQQSVRDSVYQDARQAAETIEALGRRYAVERARHRVQQGVLAGPVGENVVNDAYLVPREHCEKFRSEVLHAADGLRGVRIEVTGPWAPYSFAMPSVVADDAAAGTEP
ncbi:GvpL/GvpF family gas vesicle protein [Streptomyces adustus]|uniref:GvpL/GvpF family gas vesicle protein n=1 Tax=Streptomyces adustus TaxID=1609272 RepID=A0A5N8VEA8_9ACTN|nr:GvpL/GvpF family gas vesicle protein [Streptomyces adustus]MPY32404.1 GvpL/GvpF family gas vesicle protein [Streptomyces adustus]